MSVWLNLKSIDQNLLKSFVLSVKNMKSLFQLSLAGNQRLTHIPVDLYTICPLILDLAR